MPGPVASYSNVKEIACLALQSFWSPQWWLKLKSPTENIFRSPFMGPFLVISQTSSFLSLLQTSLQGQYKYAHWCQYLETSNKKVDEFSFPNSAIKVCLQQSLCLETSYFRQKQLQPYCQTLNSQCSKPISKNENSWQLKFKFSHRNQDKN